MLDTRLGRWIRLGVLGTAIGVLAACGSSAPATAPASVAAGQPPASTTPAGGEPSPAGGEDPGPGASTDNGPIGGDIGDRSKGSVQAQITGGLTSSVDLPFGAALASFGVSGPNSAYLPFTDLTNGTLFLTIADGQLILQYAGPNGVGLTNGATPCELKVDTLDGANAKGSFTCKGATLIQGETLGSADISGTFEGHK